MIRLVIFSLVITALICNCSTSLAPKLSNSNTKIFSRTFEGKEERIKIDFDRKLFTYVTEIENKKYIANGEIWKLGSTIEFSFPAFSEYEGLPYFPKEYWELCLIDTLDFFEIDVSVFDIETKKKVPNRMRASVSSMDPKMNVQKSNGQSKINVKTKSPKINLLLNRSFIGNEVIPIPVRGKYELKYYRLRRKTLITYSTTEKACYMETIGPVVKMFICQKPIYDVKSFDSNKDCLNRFTLIE